jgi:acyl-coenzyme A thioesterase PaaI-like protein
MSIPHLVSFDLDPKNSSPITPGFPDWERSFVSGPESPLFKVSHTLSNEDPELLYTEVSFLRRAEGPPGHVHGGATAGLLDEVMGVLVWHHQFRSVTQSIQIHYRRAIPLEMHGLILTRIMAVHEKTIEVHATLYDDQKTPFVTSQGIFHRLSDEQLKRFRDKRGSSLGAPSS